MVGITKNRFFRGLYSFYKKYSLRNSQMGFCAENVVLDYPIVVSGPQNMYLYENTIIYGGAMILCDRAKFVMKKNSGAARDLKVICGNHAHVVGKWFIGITEADKDTMLNVKNLDKDIVVEEDVWLGANVTLLSGVTIGRGASIGCGTVCRYDVPPYAVVMGNPAKVVRFNFTPAQIIEHEKVLYPENERLSLDLLESNYRTFYLDRVDEIRKYKQLHG